METAWTAVEVEIVNMGHEEEGVESVCPWLSPHCHLRRWEHRAWPLVGTHHNQIKACGFIKAKFKPRKSDMGFLPYMLVHVLEKLTPP